MAEPQNRKLWLDWQRGLAVLFMTEWHTWDSWRADAAASGPVHDAVAIVGGFAAPSFLYMAGVSQILADAALERRGVSPGERRWRAVRRALWLLGVAYLFRVAEWLLGGAWRVAGGWEGILKVDVLNVIAVSLLASALLAVGMPRGAQLALAAAGAAAVALLSPVVAGWQHAPSRLLDYLWAEWPRAGFTLFPWASFALAGAAVGRLALRGASAATFVLAGAALFVGGLVADSLPALYANQDFWRVSPSWLAMRLGVVVATSGLLQVLPASADRGLSWLRTLGRHSLLGYFLSVELPYGSLSHGLKKRLSTGQALWAVLGMICLVWAASVAADGYDRWKAGRGRPAAAAAAAS
jgi:uncharacterized membrane protein